MNKLMLFLPLDNKKKLLFVEAFLLLGWARILKERPFSIVAPSLGLPMKETSLQSNPRNLHTLKEVSHTIHIMSKYTFWESRCMVKAIAGLKMLERRNLESTIYFGTARDEFGNLIAHAWLRSGPLYITGMKGMDRFTVVGKFAKKIDSYIEGETDDKQLQS